MNREPIGLYIFRYIMGLALLGLMAMIYWSSLLLEENVQELQQEIRELGTEIQVLKDEQRKALWSRSHSPRGQVLSEPLNPRTEQAESSYPNLLSTDRFYAQTLPDLLGPAFEPRGTLRTATIGKPDNLHPMSNWASVSSWRAMVSVSVATSEFGKFETMAPDMATRMELRPTNDGQAQEFWVFLRNDVYWAPLNAEHFPEEIELAPHFLKAHPVTAHDFKFKFDAVMNPHVQEAGAASQRNYLGDIEEFRVIDDYTFVVRWKTEATNGAPGEPERRMKYSAKGLTGSLSPLARWVWQYYPDGSKIVEDDADPESYRSHAVWAQTFGEHWARHVLVSCGPWLFDGMSDEAIKFKRNSRHYNPLAALTRQQIVYFRESPEAIWQDFKAGRLDLYSVRPDQLIELDDFLASPEYEEQERLGNGIQRLDYLGRTYNYVGWNFATPYFGSAKVRQAMTMAIDRERIIDQYLNRMGEEITGPFFKSSPSNDATISPHPYDVQGAIRLLEDDGWYDANGDGIRDKLIGDQRVPFRFGLTYFVKNPTSKQNAEYVCTALKEIGVDCRLNGVDIADLSAKFEEKTFDAIYLGWALGSPPEEPKQLWHSSGASEKGSSNAVGFASEQADELIERLQYEYDLDRRLEMYHRFHRIIYDENPYTFLYSPKVAFLYRDRVQNVFIPAEREDLIPGANVASPSSSIFWLRNGEMDDEG